MNQLHKSLSRYTFGFFDLTSRYCGWAASQASSQGDLLILAILPSIAAAILIWILPTWIAMPITVALLFPPLHALALLLRETMQRPGQR